MSKEHTEQLRNSQKSRMNNQIVGGDFNAALGPGIVIERLSVGPHTLKETNKRADWMMQWLMLQKFVAIHTTYRKIHQKLVKFKTLEGVEKQLDCILINRTCLKHNRDAEANDMIHMGIDHRSVMARFVISVSKQKDSTKRIHSLHGENNTDQVNENEKPEEITEVEERYSELQRRIVQKKKKLNVVENQGKSTCKEAEPKNVEDQCSKDTSKNTEKSSRGR